MALLIAFSRHYITEIIEHIGRPCLKNTHFILIQINQSKGEYTREVTWEKITMHDIHATEYIHVRLLWRRVTRMTYTPRNIPTRGYPGEDNNAWRTRHGIYPREVTLETSNTHDAHPTEYINTGVVNNMYWIPMILYIIVVLLQIDVSWDQLSMLLVDM